ncbi:TPA: hypothetical protein DEO28_04340 [Candidatus Dependentiae bacterium]|nr:MAG: hypothetical protein UR14_C0006G0105 [candidate division TM6 bacterium GW2011_GWE2_31_21]KKP53472.1 MAG: hypothetical protein UR43_C0004G0013 [candidate division TM6 bacterium GW2011_GWF2_33_332]HBS48286.1 hypothetical protein [Candidatus Dependentiae bacterium]HBZ73713.1 hypothetical protein [Candidatus Dependentiae bacterium]
MKIKSIFTLLIILNVTNNVTLTAKAKSSTPQPVTKTDVFEKDYTEAAKTDLLFIKKALIAFPSTKDVYESLYKIYFHLQNHEINWSLIGENSQEMQKIANSVMNQINDFFIKKGINKAPLQKLQATDKTKITENEARRLLTLANDEANKHMQWVKSKGKGFVGWNKTGDAANKLYKDAALKFAKAAKLYITQKSIQKAVEMYRMQIQALESIAYKPVNPIYHYLDKLALTQAKINANSLAANTKIANYKPYAIKQEVEELKQLWKNGGEAGQKAVKEDWKKNQKSNTFFFKEKTLEAEQKYIETVVQ